MNLPTRFIPIRRALIALLSGLTLALVFTAPSFGADTMVRLQTSQGLIDIRLYNSAAPLTVSNFLGYLRSGAYTGTFFHRSVPGFIVQGGGWSLPNAGAAYIKTPAGPPVVNEFSASRSNLRGTVAMAKLGGNPNSATTEWFVNLANNAANLDNQNGGFTVFGKVTTSGMAVFDAIAKLRIVNDGGARTALPIEGTLGLSILPTNLVRVLSVAELPDSANHSDSDRLFNYLEAAYPLYLPLAGATSGTALGYYYRHYPASNSYVGTKEGQVYYLVPAINNDINLLGPLADWHAIAAGEGY